MARLNAHNIERTIQQLPAVYTARVTLEDNDEKISKIHVLVAPGRSPKKIVRDIESLLVLKFKRDIDYRKISLVQGEPEDFQPFVRPRLRLLAAEERASEGGRRVIISLANEEEIHLGTAEGTLDIDLHSLAARATLDALTNLVPATNICDVAVQSIAIQDEPLVLVALTVSDGKGKDRLIGSAFTQGNALMAASRATLDALNRRFFYV